ncbi:hypothetical protein ACFYW6_38255 [Streptomyces sp. NPDC002659]|uniref:hypothetical protein n=1 Tax=Streptomyces sp. NPDC002659 TaxID=3364656 RepID=UPI0036AAD5E8
MEITGGSSSGGSQTGLGDSGTGAGWIGEDNEIGGSPGINIGLDQVWAAVPYSAGDR